MTEEPREVAANQWGTIAYYPQWNTLELTWSPNAPDGPATFPTAWFETRDRLYAWLA